MKLKKIISCLMSVIISLVCFSGMTAVAEDEIRLGYWVFDTDCYDVITPSLSYINAATVEITSFANPYRLLITLTSKFEGYSGCVGVTYSLPEYVKGSDKELISRYKESNSDRRISYIDIPFSMAVSSEDYTPQSQYSSGHSTARDNIYDVRLYSERRIKHIVYTRPQYTNYRYNNRYSVNIEFDSSADVMTAEFVLFGKRFRGTTLFNNQNNEETIDITEPHDSLLCGDTDDDGRISISDSIILNRYLAGTVESLPCSDPPPLAPEDDLS